ncbi:hypothetical protein DsansV1_C18g0155301 [Dioscorea sansibarensis]
MLKFPPLKSYPFSLSLQTISFPLVLHLHPHLLLYIFFHLSLFFSSYTNKELGPTSLGKPLGVEALVKGKGLAEN